MRKLRLREVKEIALQLVGGRPGIQTLFFLDSRSFCSFCFLMPPPSLAPCPLAWGETLYQGSAHFHCKRSDSRYFRLCRSYRFCHNYSALPSIQVNRRNCVPVTVLVDTEISISCTFHESQNIISIFFKHWKIYKSFLACSPYKNR